MTITQLYFSARGRINRSRYWLGLVGLMVGGVLSGLCMIPLNGRQPDDPMTTAQIIGIAGYVIGIVLVTYASILLAIKRWHDRDKSGWWVLIGLVPVIGGLWALIENGFLKGTDGPNRFGPDPLGGYGDRIGQVFDAPTAPRRLN